MVNPDDPRSQYRQIATNIRAAIWRRELAPGGQVPGINAIRETYGVANATAQDALALLKSWGLTEARPGVGTFVRDNRAVEHVMTSMTFPRDGKRLTWREIAASQGMVGQQEITGAGRDPAPVEAAEALGVGPSEAVTWRQRLLLLDNRPVQIATSYYPARVAEIAPELGRPERLSRNSPALLADKGLVTVVIRDRVVARMATTGEADVLGIEPNDPVTDILRVQRAEDATVVEVCAMVTDGYRMHSVWESRA
jgi:GntR family transcriptional regulator